MSRQWIGALALVGVLGAAAEALGQTPRASVAPGPSEIAGTVHARLRVVMHAPVDGVIDAIAVAEGDVVEAEALLVEMRDDVQEARVGSARAVYQADADLRAARLSVEESTAVLERTRNAHGKGAAAAWELRRAELALDRARTELDAAEERRARDRERLRIEQANLARYVLHAPFAGAVTRVRFDPGATVTRADELLTLVSLDELEAVFFVPVERFEDLEVGRAYRLRGDPPAAGPLRAELASVDAEIDPASGTVRAVFTIDNRESRHPSGFGVALLLDEPAP